MEPLGSMGRTVYRPTDLHLFDRFLWYMERKIYHSHGSCMGGSGGWGLGLGYRRCWPVPSDRVVGCSLPVLSGRGEWLAMCRPEVSHLSRTCGARRQVQNWKATAFDLEHYVWNQIMAHRPRRSNVYKCLPLEFHRSGSACNAPSENKRP